MVVPPEFLPLHQNRAAKRLARPGGTSRNATTGERRFHSATPPLTSRPQSLVALSCEKAARHLDEVPGRARAVIRVAPCARARRLCPRRRPGHLSQGSDSCRPGNSYYVSGASTLSTALPPS